MHTILAAIALLIQIEVILIIVRVLLSWFPGINPYNPVVRLLRALVDPVLNPFRRVLPSFSGIDFSPLLAILVLGELSRLLDGAASGSDVVGILESLLLNIAIVFIIIVLLRVFVSLFNASPFHPVVMVIRQISTPLVRPFAAFAPRSRTFDTAALVALVVYFVAYIVLRQVFSVTG